MSIIIDPSDIRGGLPSASSLDGDIRCLGRRALMAKMPKKTGTKATERGSRVHAVMEGSLDIEALNDGEKMTVQKMMNEEAKILDELDFHGAEPIREKRLWAVNDDFERLYSGQIDVLHKLGNRGVLMDYKNWFKGVVAIEENWQMRSQAVLVYKNFGISDLSACLVHPGFRPDDMSQITKFNREQLEYYADRIEYHISQMTEDAPRTPNRISCKYCTGKKECDEYQADLEKVREQSGVMKGRPKYEDMTPKERGERLTTLKLAAEVIKEEMEAFKAMLKLDPDSVEGFKLSKESFTRKITDDIAADKLVVQAHGEEVAAQCRDFSLTKYEKYLHGRGIAKSEAKNLAEKILFDVLLKTPKEPSLIEK